MSQGKVRALIEMRLRNFGDDNDLPIAWEDVTFEPPSDATGEPLPYLKFNLLPAQTRSDDLAGDLRTWQGVAQITIYEPSGRGPGAGELVLAQLDTLYAASKYIPDAALPVLIVSPVSAGPGFEDGAYWAVPTSFEYRADLSTTS